MAEATRIVKDSMGEMKVPEKALYGAQTQRAVENFPISGKRMPRAFIQALGYIKWAAASANLELGLLDKDISLAVQKAALEVAEGMHDEHFPIDVFQTGSGTSSNMNANEVISTLASKQINKAVHPNDHVNCGQSSNDVIPTAIHVSAALRVAHHLLPALNHLVKTIDGKAKSDGHHVKTGRTHLMDAMPLTFAQELGAWSAQIKDNIKRLEQAAADIHALAQGGTAIGTGINAHPKFSEHFCKILTEKTGIPFCPAEDKFSRIASQDSAVALSGSLKTTAISIMKIANDLRLMNSGPIAGFSEIALRALQPGSSIMPGKVNPVIPEAACMVAAQVIGNDACISVAGQSGSFQLNVMLPVIALNLIESIELLANISTALADKAIKDFTINHEAISEDLMKNPILITALNAEIGYEVGAKIAKRAYAEKRSLIDVALEETNLDEATLRLLLDPLKLTKGGLSD